MNTGPVPFCNALAACGCALFAVAHLQGVSAADALTGFPATDAPIRGLTPAQISACTEEIRRARAGWKYWPGDPAEAAVRLGRLQKALFQGRCAGHPQAKAYLASADRMLGHAVPANRAPRPIPLDFAGRSSKVPPGE